jgi:hypothetical protein
MPLSDDARANMLGTNSFLRGEVPSALLPLNPDTDFKLNDLSIVDASFTAQMADLYYNHGLGERRYAFLFTANSAIPVADAVSGCNAVLGKRGRTELGYIAVNRNLVRMPDEDIKAEAERLDVLLQDRDSVVVVDEMVSTGNTLRLSALVLKATHFSGEQYAMRGRWYTGVTAEEVLNSRMSSTLIEEMTAIGVDAGLLIKHPQNVQ